MNTHIKKYNLTRQAMQLRGTLTTLGILIVLPRYQTQTVQENVVFDKIAEVSIARATWRITFVLDLAVYDHLFDEVSTYIDEVAATTNRTIYNQLNVTENMDWMSPFHALQDQLQHLNDTKQDFYRTFKNYQTLHQRRRRAIIPVVSDLLGFLFGTASEGDLHDIRNAIKNLNANQQKLTHIISKSLTIINQTRDEVVLNRNRVNKLLDAVSNIYKQLDIFRRYIKEAYAFRQFVFFHMQLNSLISNARELIIETIAHFNELQLQINMLATGQLSPSCVMPEQLLQILTSIQTRLPRSLQMPADPSLNLWSYYRLINTQTAYDSGKIYIILNIPLINFVEQYEIYKVYSLPVVDIDNFKTKKSSNTRSAHPTAEYILETDVFGINKRRSKYIILKDYEARSCASATNRFCEVNSPIYPINLAKVCIISLFLNDKRSKDKYCRINVRPNDVLPRAAYIRRGVWMVSTTQKLRMRVTCDAPHIGQDYTITIRPPLDVISIKENCIATGSQLTLPRYHELTTDKRFQIKPNFTFRRRNFTLWEPFKQQTYIDMKSDWVPEKLKNVPQLDMNSLIDSVNSIHPIENSPINYTSSTATIGLSITIVIIITYLCKANRIACFNRSSGIPKRSTSTTTISSEENVRKITSPKPVKIKRNRKVKSGVLPTTFKQFKKSRNQNEQTPSENKDKIATIIEELADDSTDKSKEQNNITPSYSIYPRV